MDEAKIKQTEHGVVPADGGWWVLNLADLVWDTRPGAGTCCMFESPDAQSPTLGVNVHVLGPGESPGLYHRETEQEGFLVLSGECVAIVEEQERPMRPGDYLHTPPGCAHMIVGAGDGPCALLMVGTRNRDGAIEYPVSEVAARHGVSVTKTTSDAREAYAGQEEWRPTRSIWPLR